MVLPKGFDPENDGPFRVCCARCKQHCCQPKRAYKLLSTGIVEQLYICQACHWGTVVRYDPAAPRQYVAAQVISPGKGWGWVRIIPKIPAAKSKYRPPSG